MNINIKSCFLVASRLSINLNIYRSINFNLELNHNLPLKVTNKNVLENIPEDLSEVSPYFPKSYNLAAYINSSKTLQNLLHLNVNLDKIEKKPHIAEKILKLDFEADIKHKILFLNDIIDIELIGDYITKNPLVLCEDIDDIKIRINYLQSKCFSKNQIKHIISKNPFWLMFSTVRIDKRLGFFQTKFSLSGHEVRTLTTRQPRIITYNLHHINTNSFVIKEEMGFNDEEIKKIILVQPKLWMISQKSLLERFNFLHNTANIPHDIILKYPNSLLSRSFRVKQRHFFLKQLCRAQYDPTKENYIPIMALVEDSDIEFCKKYAKCHIDDFNLFLKTQ